MQRRRVQDFEGGGSWKVRSRRLCCQVLPCLSLQVMYARQVDQRSAIFQKALEVGEAYQLRTKVGTPV